VTKLSASEGERGEGVTVAGVRGRGAVADDLTVSVGLDFANPGKGLKRETRTITANPRITTPTQIPPTIKLNFEDLRTTFVTLHSSGSNFQNRYRVIIKLIG
jgi:hypothetical protein